MRQRKNWKDKKCHANDWANMYRLAVRNAADAQRGQQNEWQASNITSSSVTCRWCQPDQKSESKLAQMRMTAMVCCLVKKSAGEQTHREMSSSIYEIIRTSLCQIGCTKFFAPESTFISLPQRRQRRSSSRRKILSLFHFFIVTVFPLFAKNWIKKNEHFSISTLARNSSTVSFFSLEQCYSNQNMDSSMDRNAANTATETVFISQVTSQTILGEREREEV